MWCHLLLHGVSTVAPPLRLQVAAVYLTDLTTVCTHPARCQLPCQNCIEQCSMLNKD